MFRKDKEVKPKTKTINIVLMDGGLGDHIGSLVAVNHISKHYPWIKVELWVPDYLLDFAKHVLSPGVRTEGFSAMRGRYNPSKPTKTTQWDGITSPMKIHLVDYAFLKLCDENPGIEHKNYLRIRPEEIKSRDFDLPDEYAVITTAYTAKVREFPGKEVNKLATFLKSKNITPVFLGQKNTKTGALHTIKGELSQEIDFSLGIDLIDKTSLLEAANIMHHSKAVFGVDNGLMHLAGCTQAPIIGGFTTVSPDVRMPIRENVLGHNFYAVTPNISLDCRFCQEKTNFLYGHDYRNCWYEDRLCVTQMTADKFIKGLEYLMD